MPTEIDSLQIKINAEASKANTAIDNLITKIDTLTTSLTGLNGDSLTSLARGTRDFGSAMQLFRDTKAVDFNKIARGISKFSTIDSSSFTKISGGLVGLATGLGSISNVDNLGGISKVVNSIKSLSSVDMSRFNTVAFANVGNSIRDFTHSLSTIGNVDKNIVSLVNSVSRLSSSGKNIENVSKEFPAIASQIYGFVNQLNGLNINFDISGLANLIGNIRNLGGKVATNAITTIPQLAKAMNNLMTTLSQSPQVSQNVIQMTNALANLSAQGSKVGNSTRSIQRGLNNASRSATKATFSFKSLASIFGTFYANAFLLIRGIKGLHSAIESTADYIEAFNYFNVALGKIGKDWSFQFEKYGYDSAEAYADSFSERLTEKLKGLSGLEIELDADGSGLLSETGRENLGLNIKEVTQYAAQLSSITNSVGQVGEVSLATASSITKLGADLSSLFNIDYSTAMEKLQSGLIGQSRALYSFGIDITNASLQTLAYELGVEKAVSEMTQAEKMQLRLIAILRQSKIAWGDLANTINSPSNMMRQFSNNLKETGMVLGQLFIPVLQKVMPIVNGVTIAIKRLLESIASLLGIKLDLQGFGQGYSGLGEEIGGVADSLDDATAAAKKFKTYALGIDELNIQPQQDSGGSVSGGGIGSGIDLTDEILEATAEYEEEWQKAFDNMENKAQEWADNIEKIFKPITDPFKNMIKSLKEGGFEEAGMYASDVIVSIFDTMSNALENVDWDEIGNNIGSFLKGISWTKVFKSVGNFIETAINSAVDLWKGSFSADPIATTIVSALAIAKFTGLDKVIASKIVSAIPTVLTVAVTAVVGFEWGKELGKKLFPDDAEWYENFKLFGEGGFFDAIENAGFANTTTAIMDTLASIWKPLLSEELQEDYDEGLLIIHKNLLDIENMFKDYDWGNLWEDFKSQYFGLFEVTKLEKSPIENILENWEQDLDEAAVELKVWYESDVSPWFEERQWIKLWENVKSAFVTKWNEISTWWKTSALVSWWNKDVSPWFTKEKWLNLFDSIRTALSAKWTQVVLWWNTLGIVKWYNENVAPWFTKEKWTFSGIKDGLSTAFNSAIGAIKQLWNSFATWLNNALKLDFGGFQKTFNVLGEEIKIDLPGFQFELGRIPTFQTGGFPEDGLFMANHNELVGKFSNGRTAVANNEQIVAGIEYGVERAVERALAPYLSDIARNTRETADKDMSVNIGDRDIARANARGSRSMGYALIT